jgi:hypothetical protein
MYLFFLVLEFFLGVLNRFWIFVPATPAAETRWRRQNIGDQR